jgi:ribosomal protein S18 acetylase RimI-like enzyme
MLADGIIVDPAKKSEIESIEDVVRRSYEEYTHRMSQEDGQTILKNLADGVRNSDDAVRLVARHNDRVCGYVAYFPPGKSDGVIFPREWASIRSLAVDPLMRGRGISRMLMAQCFRRADADQAGIFGLHTSEAMHTARAMYERMGFRQVRELPPRYGLRYWAFMLDREHFPLSLDAAAPQGG